MIRSVWRISPLGWVVALVGSIAALIYHALPLFGVHLLPVWDALGDVTHIVALGGSALVIFQTLRRSPE